MRREDYWERLTLMRKIPALDIAKQIAPIRREIDSAIKRVIKKSDFILGSEVEAFEKAVEKYCRVRFAMGVSNGTDAIRLALLALGVKPGEGVICPAFTYFATAGAISAIGAVPVFADIDPRTYCLTAAEAERIFRKNRRIRIKAVIPVHLYGQCADMDGIIKVARKLGLMVIEDAAQAFGAEYKGNKAGTLGDCGTVSFYPGKNLGAFGDAGMVITNKKQIAEKILILRNQGNKDRYYHVMLGSNNRMDGIQAAVLNCKLKYLDSWNSKRNKIALYYNRSFEGTNIITPFVAVYNKHIYHQYVLRMEGSNKRLLAYLRRKRIDSRVFYPVPLHLQKCFGYLGYRRGDFPEAERAAYQILALPIYPELTAEEKNYIVQSVKEIVK
ncbi:MAG: DegT/DnrJ/EryC1/StrS family aminotransferase [Candidatus Omnitrophota bacterium]